MGKTELEKGAYHEAGHAIDRIDSGGQVSQVELAPDGQGVTRTGANDYADWVRNAGLQAALAVRRQMRNLVAGYAAQLAFERGSPVPKNELRKMLDQPVTIPPSALKAWDDPKATAPETDFERAIGLMRWLMSPAEPKSVDWADVKDRLAEEFEEVTGALQQDWPRVERLAEALASRDPSHRVVEEAEIARIIKGPDAEPD